MPPVQRELRREDKRFDLLTEVATVSANYYQSVWNVFFSLRDREKPESRRIYREEMQKASAQAQGMYVKLSKLFDNKTIDTEWKQLTEVYHSIYYPLGRGERTTEEAMNQRLVEADRLRQSILGKMEDELTGRKEKRGLCQPSLNR